VAGPVFLTGGSGVVGRAVLRRLLDEGRTVRALARSAAAAAVVGSLGAEAVAGDVLDPGSLDAALRGCEVVYHVAGVNQFCLRDPSPMVRTNVDGTANVVEAAARAGVGRVVYTSSTAALGEAEGTVGDERSPHRGTFLSAYERSKFEAERVARELAARNGVELVCLNPSSVQGPGRVTGTGQLLIRYLQGRLKLWVDTTVSLVDIDDCAEGHVLSETKGTPDDRYVLNGASLTTAELLAVMARVAPALPRPRLVPPPLAVAVTGVVEGAARVRGRTPLVCRESLRTLLHGHRYDGSKAARELGLQYRPVEETLRRTAIWLVEQGLVPPISDMG
jgi:dihydroflavonol-4-reductase